MFSRGSLRRYLMRARPPKKFSHLSELGQKLIPTYFYVHPCHIGRDGEQQLMYIF